MSFFRREKIVYTAPQKPLDIIAQWYYFVNEAQSITNDIAFLIQYDFLEDNIEIEEGEEGEERKNVSIPIFSTLTSLLSLNAVQTGLGLNLLLSEGGRTSLLDVILRAPPQMVARSGVLVLRTILRLLATYKKDYDGLLKTKYTMPDADFNKTKKTIHFYAKQQVEIILASLNQAIMSVLSTRVTEIGTKQQIEQPPPFLKGHET